jgi:hypothetical protein
MEACRRVREQGICNVQVPGISNQNRSPKLASLSLFAKVVAEQIGTNAKPDGEHPLARPLFPCPLYELPQIPERRPDFAPALTWSNFKRQSEKQKKCQKQPFWQRHKLIL